MSDDYPLLLRDKLTEELLNSSFNQSNPNFPRYFNKSTISYFPTYNHFFLIEQENVQNEIKFNLWDVALDAMENIKNKTISKKFSIILENENNSEYKPSKEFCLEILNNSGFNEDFLVLYGGAHVFGMKIYIYIYKYIKMLKKLQRSKILLIFQITQSFPFKS